MASPVKLLLIHGLNNSLEAFHPLRDALSDQGFEVHQVCLPGHGDDRYQVRDLNAALMSFDKQMQALTTTPYVAVAFSQGALYLQQWITQNPTLAPKRQALLAPALFIRRLGFMELLANIVPQNWWIWSQSPAELRRYKELYFWEYRILFAKARLFVSNPMLRTETLILVDEKDELVNAKKLKELYGERTQVLRRPYLSGKKPGKYHILFHPEYFTAADWEKFIQGLKSFLSAEA